MKKLLLKNLGKKKNNEDGFTMIDLIIAIFIFMLFGVYIVTLVVNSYVKSVDIQAGSYASAYVTQVAQAIDDVSLYDIENHQDDIINFLKTRGELPIDFLDGSDYTVSVNVEDVSDAVSDELKKVAITVNYSVNGEQKQIKIDKLKINDESRYWLRISMGSSERSVGTIVNTRTGNPIGELTKHITGINPETGEVSITIDLVYFPDEDPPKAKPTDIVLVIDNSISMLYSAQKRNRPYSQAEIETYYTRKTLLLNAARNFVDTIYNWQQENQDSMGEIYFSVVQFHGRNRQQTSLSFTEAASTLLDLTNDVDTVKRSLTKVNARDQRDFGQSYRIPTNSWYYDPNKEYKGYNPDTLDGKFPDTISGTNIQEGIQEGVRALQLNTTQYGDHNKIMILLTDGVPTEDTYNPANGSGHSAPSGKTSNQLLNNATYIEIMDQTWGEIKGLETKKIQFVSMMIGLTGVEYDYQSSYWGGAYETQLTNDEGDREIVKEIFGTHEQPVYGRFYDVQTVDLERVIRDEVVADIQAIILSFNNTVVVDTFPDDIANNFELTVHGNPNYTADGDEGVSKITWTPTDLTAGSSTSISYTLKLKDMSDKDLMNTNGELATNGDVSLTSVTSSGDPVTADFDGENGSSPTILIEKIDK